MLGQSTFVTCALSWDEHAHEPEQFLNRAVDPRFVQAVRKPIDRKARLAVIETADDGVHSSKDAETDLGVHIAVEILDVDIGIQFLDAPRSDLGFLLAIIVLAKQDRATEIRRLDGVKVDDE